MSRAKLSAVIPLEATVQSSRGPRWKHYPLRFGVEGGQQFLYQSCFGRSGFARRNNVADDRLEPGIFVHAKYDPRPLSHLQLIDRRFGEQFAKTLTRSIISSPSSSSVIVCIVLAMNSRSAP